MLIQLSRLIAVMVIGVALPTVSMPDEGMWPFDGLPLQQLKEKYNFEPSKDWLDHVRLGSVRFDTGGSGSFVSPNGLVMTNHHVALETLQKISTQEKDWVKDGFSSKAYGSEPKGTDLTLRQLIEVKNVTKEILALEEDKRDEAIKEMCEKLKDDAKHIVADPVVLYDGGEFRIHVYHIYDDVRVVFAPEKQVAFYGGDPDNFTYPRFDLDCAFFRVYEDGKPIDSSKFYFKWNSAGAKTDELIFVSGHPGKTERALTHAEMEFHRDLQVPRIVKQLHTMRDNMKKKMAESEEQAFKLRDQFFGIENSLKAYEGHLAGLKDPEMMAKMKARDDELIEKSGKPEVKAAFEAIAKGMADFKAMLGDKTMKMAERQKMQKQLNEEILPGQQGDHHEGALRHLRHLQLPGCDVHAASRVRHGEGLRGRHDDGATQDHVQRPLRAQRGLRQPAAVRPAQALDGRQVQAQPRHAVQLRLRQLGQPDPQPQRRSRRPRV
jgi:hypothetical protein